MFRYLFLAFLAVTVLEVQCRPLVGLLDNVQIKETNRVRREVDITLLDAIKELKDHPDYEQILQAAGDADTDALEKENPHELTDEERKAIYFYTMNYPFHEILNVKLWGKAGPGMFQKYVDLLDCALSKIPKADPITVWRVVGGHQILAEDDCITWPAYSSTTSDEDNNILNREGESTLYEIRNASGHNIKAYSANPQEEEILLPRDTKLKVMEVLDPDGDQLKYVATFVEDEDCDRTASSPATTLTMSSTSTTASPPATTTRSPPPTTMSSTETTIDTTTSSPATTLAMSSTSTTASPPATTTSSPPTTTMSPTETTIGTTASSPATTLTMSSTSTTTSPPATTKSSPPPTTMSSTETTMDTTASSPATTLTKTSFSYELPGYLGQLNWLSFTR